MTPQHTPDERALFGHVLPGRADAQAPHRDRLAALHAQAADTGRSAEARAAAAQEGAQLAARLRGPTAGELYDARQRRRVRDERDPQ